MWQIQVTSARVHYLIVHLIDIDFIQRILHMNRSTRLPIVKLDLHTRTGHQSKAPLVRLRFEVPLGVLIRVTLLPAQPT